MITLNEFIAKTKPIIDKDRDLEVYKHADSSYGNKHYVLIKGLKKWNEFCKQSEYMQQVDHKILANYKDYIKKFKSMLLIPIIHTNSEFKLSWDVYNDKLAKNYKFVDEIAYDDFNIKYWKKMDWY